MSRKIGLMGDADLPAVALLLRDYRVFYGQPDDLDAAESWLRQHHCSGLSRVFVAKQDGVPLGFAQLFPMPSTVRCAMTWVLNDLYVSPRARRLGIAIALLDAARDFAREQGAAYITLETMRDNHAAQAAYRKAGWTAEATQWYSVDFPSRKES